MMRVTDHAVLRYMERVQGFDVEAVRQHIARSCAVVSVTPARGVCLARQDRLGAARG